jgi:hypothetical protein
MKRKKLREYDLQKLMKPRPNNYQRLSKLFFAKKINIRPKNSLTTTFIYEQRRIKKEVEKRKLVTLRRQQEMRS